MAWGRSKIDGFKEILEEIRLNKVENVYILPFRNFGNYFLF